MRTYLATSWGNSFLILMIWSADSSLEDQLLNVTAIDCHMWTEFGNNMA